MQVTSLIYNLRTFREEVLKYEGTMNQALALVMLKSASPQNHDSEIHALSP